MARTGGVAIFIGVTAALGVQALGERYLDWGGNLLADPRVLLGLYGSLTAMCAVGLLDDVVGLKAGPKLLGQLAAAAIAVAGGLRIEFVGNPFGGGLLQTGLLGIPMTLLYFVAFANIINLIDGLDGLAAGITAIAATSMLVLAAQDDFLVAAALAAAVIGACLGFLRYNFHPASVFMGDSGSNFLGFALAAVSLLGIMKSIAAIALAVPLLIVGVPIFDTGSAIFRRWRHGQPIQKPDAGHIHHRLLGRGFDQRQTVLIIYVWSAALGIGAYTLRYAPASIKIVSFLVLMALSAVMAYWLGLYEAAHHHDGSSAAAAAARKMAERDSS